MSTKIIIPRATSEDSSIGTPEKNWGDGYFDDLHCLSNFYCPLVTSDARGIGEYGESKFDTTINALIIWNGEQWLELGATTQVELVLIAGEGGTVQGAGLYSKGAPVIISAVPQNSNYVFSYWNGDVSFVQDDKSDQTFVTLSKATTTLTAIFSAKTYNIFTSVEGGEGSEIPGLVTTDPVGAALPAETAITFTASTYSAFSGKYAFGFWAGEYIENNPEQRNNNPLTINSLSSEVNLQAVFELQGKTITMQKYIDDNNSKLVEHFNNNVELLLNGLSLPDGEGVAKEYGYGDSFDFSFTIDADSSDYYNFEQWEIINDSGATTTLINDTISSYTLDEDIVVRAYFKAVDSNNNTIPDLYDALIQLSEIDSDQDNIIDSYDDNILTAATSSLTVTNQDITNGLNTFYYDLSSHHESYNIAEQLTHQINFTTNSQGDITYTSGDETVVTVSDTGLITVVGAGSTTITIIVPETNTHTDIYRTLNVSVTDETDTDGDGIPDNIDEAPNQSEQTITWDQVLTNLTEAVTFNATSSDTGATITYTLSSADTLGTLDGSTFTPSNSASTDTITVTATASATNSSFEKSVTKDLSLDQTDTDSDGIPDRLDSNFVNESDTPISAGGYHTVYLKSDGTVWAAGRNWEGQLGNQLVTNESSAPVQVIPENNFSTFDSVAAISANYYHTVYLKSDGKVWAAGRNTYGQLGDGGATQKNNPVQVINTNGSVFDGVVGISTGTGHTVYLKDDNTVWAAGWNEYGQLGDGTDNDRSNPVQVIDANGDPFTGVAAISAGAFHTVYLKSDGTVWAAGYNTWGQLGDDTEGNRSNPVQVIDAAGDPFTGVAAISAGGFLTIYLKSDGTVWAAGDNRHGQLGNGTSGLDSESSTPVKVNNMSDVVAIYAGGYHTVYLKSNDTVWAAGLNDYGQLGDGTTTQRNNPVQVTNVDESGLSGVVGISAGEHHTVYLKSDGTVWATGRNQYGQLADGKLQSTTQDSDKNRRAIKSWFFDPSAPDTIGKFLDHTLIVDAPPEVEMTSDGSVPNTNVEGGQLFLWHPNSDSESKVGFQLNTGSNSIEIVNTLEEIIQGDNTDTLSGVNVKVAIFGTINVIYTDNGIVLDSPLDLIGSYPTSDSELSANYAAVPSSPTTARTFIEFNAGQSITAIHGLYGYFAFYTED
jgi:alpha-tubulin suppressor-like RCC1 family protein